MSCAGSPPASETRNTCCTPFRLESNANQRPSGETSKPSIVWFPLVTGRACATDSGAWLGIGSDQTFDVSVNAE